MGSKNDEPHLFSLTVLPLLLSFSPLCKVAIFKNGHKKCFPLLLHTSLAFVSIYFAIKEEASKIKIISISLASQYPRKCLQIAFDTKINLVARFPP